MSPVRGAVSALAVTLLLGSCGGNAAELTGYRREPAPLVGELALPDLTDGGREMALRADPGELLVIYFGFTNCPDFCPTTLSDLKLARQRLDDDQAERIDVAMVTVDPERDLDVLPRYVTSFFDDGHALGTDEPARLAQVAVPFGVSYEVAENESGETEVAHTTALYAVDDAGELALTWQFGISIADLATDLGLLLEAEA